MISGKLKYLSGLLLIIANTMPLIAVLFFDWNLFQILFLYWLESGVIGFYNILKLIKVSDIDAPRLFIVPFFIIHYGGFMSGHLWFLLIFFAPDLTYSSFFPPLEILLPLIYTIKFSAIALVVSHGISFFFNFIRNREYERTNIVKQMMEPYRRILVMHLTIILGALVILLFKEAVFFLVLLIVIKTITDLKFHLKEHAAS